MTIIEGEVGPELENYVNALLDRIRELEAKMSDFEVHPVGEVAALKERIAELEAECARLKRIAEYTQCCPKCKTWREPPTSPPSQYSQRHFP